MQRAIYLVALENVFGNAIFENQVKKLLLRLKKLRGADLELTLLVLLPWIELTRRGFYSNFKRHRSDIRALKEELAEGGVEFVCARTLFPSAFFNMKLPGLLWFSLAAVPVVAWQLARKKIPLLHCRYYYAAFAARAAAKLAGRRVKVIFDVRTLLPEQGIVNRVWAADSFTFRLWKAVESRLVRRCAATVSVSPAMTARLAAEYPGLAPVTIPNFVDRELFRPDKEMRESRRREFGLEKRKVLVYSGTLGGRYPAERMAGCAGEFFRAFGPDSFFLVLTSSDDKRTAPLAEQLEKLGLVPGRHWRTLGCASEEVAGYLSAADWALLVLGDFLTSETFLPLKFGEYLAAGLPILTHPGCRALAGLIESYGVGAVIGPETSGDELTAGREQMSRRCLEVAEREYDLDICSGRYARLYQELAAQ
ncbi:MAG TPA: glycosyltransferase [Candidatus Glassbacteria bacterium]|nr:glycosyltransferase [Candidatus Glassbacteria bacterium]